MGINFIKSKKRLNEKKKNNLFAYLQNLLS